MRKVGEYKIIEPIGMPKHEKALFFIAYIVVILGVGFFLGKVL